MAASSEPPPDYWMTGPLQRVEDIPQAMHHFLSTILSEAPEAIPVELHAEMLLEMARRLNKLLVRAYAEALPDRERRAFLTLTERGAPAHEINEYLSRHLSAAAPDIAIPVIQWFRQRYV